MTREPQTSTAALRLVDISDGFGALWGHLLTLPTLIGIGQGPARRPADGEAPLMPFARFGGARSSVTVAAVGDLLIQDTLRRYAERSSAGYAALFEDVTQIIRATDVACLNFEGVVDERRHAGFVNFVYPPSVASDIRGSGFDVIQLANNHALDRGRSGVETTLDAITDAGLQPTGTRRRGGRYGQWHTTTEFNIHGRVHRIAWLGCTSSLNFRLDRSRQVLRCYGPGTEVIDIVAALASRPDIDAVIVMPHWGWEYAHRPSSRQRRFARAVLEAGATAVIGTHPHVVQPIEHYRTADGRDTLIAFSLGNFVSNQPNLATRSSLVLLLGMAVTNGGKLAIEEVGWIPLRMAQQGLYGVKPIDVWDVAADAKPTLAHLFHLLPLSHVVRPDPRFWSFTRARAITTA